ncbi:hypothetical protein N8292_00530 [Gammaproteobacteria bacterium]|nr:hypothetical protein [Gammaproteobacteria bacterium]
MKLKRTIDAWFGFIFCILGLSGAAASDDKEVSEQPMINKGIINNNFFI